LQPTAEEFVRSAEAKARTLAVSENPASEAQKERREREKEGQFADLRNVSTQESRAERKSMEFPSDTKKPYQTEVYRILITPANLDPEGEIKQLQCNT
jgi:hypothetical protein